MSRIMGSETEYGIATPSDPLLSPIVTSTHAVVAYGLATPDSTVAHWDFSHEHPLRDSRGFDLKRYRTVPVVDPHALGVANVMLGNGGRFYVDHAHPEYSSPETTNAFDASLFDIAGDVILRRAADHVARLSAQGHSVLEHHPPCPPLKLYKNNVDGKGASYGSHENYLYNRDVPFDRLAAGLMPLFVTRQVLIGAGRVGLGQLGEEPGFQISQRADYIEQEISLETTLNRGIINTRDEPHADASRFGRLHVIIGDANMAHTSNVLKFGITALVLDAIEAGVDFSDLALTNPVPEVQRVSRDTSLAHELSLKDGRRLTALDILGEYHRRVTPSSVAGTKVHALWAEVMELLAHGPQAASHLLDWCAKWSLLSSYVAKGASWSDPKLALVDLQYADLDPAKGLYHALVRTGRMHTIHTQDDIDRAAEHAPTDTRAYLRGGLITHAAQRVSAASWASVVLDGVTRIDMPELTMYTQESIGDIPGFLATLSPNS